MRAFNFFLPKKTTSARQDSPTAKQYPGVVIQYWTLFRSLRKGDVLLNNFWENFADAPHDVSTFFCPLSVAPFWFNVLYQSFSHALYLFPRLHFLYFLTACHLSSWHLLTSSTRNCPKSTLSLSNERPKLAHAAYDSRSNGELKDHRRLFHVTSLHFCNAELFENRILIRRLTITHRRPFSRPIG
jgi:hypothetical protein